MVDTYLAPTAVLCNKNWGREKEAMEVQVVREERLPPPHRDCRGVKAGLPAQGHTSARTGQSCSMMLQGPQGAERSQGQAGKLSKL